MINIKQLLTPEELIGKTIQRTKQSEDDYFVFFNDDTFCIFVPSGWEEKEVELEDSKFALKPNDQGNVRRLRELDFITEQEYLDFLDQNRKNIEERSRNQEIETLKELKEKYPNE